MRKFAAFFAIASILFLAGCANHDYSGLNYVTVHTQTQDWKVVGGKDEQSVKFTVAPDGTVTYSADKSDTSSALGAALQAQQAQTAAILATLGPLAQQAIKIAGPAAVAP